MTHIRIEGKGIGDDRFRAAVEECLRHATPATPAELCGQHWAVVAVVAAGLGALAGLALSRRLW